MDTDQFGHGYHITKNNHNMDKHHKEHTSDRLDRTTTNKDISMHKMIPSQDISIWI